jgi:hypothetical protein
MGFGTAGYEMPFLQITILVQERGNSSAQKGKA